MTDSDPAPSPAFAAAFAQRALGGVLGFADFVDLALFHPELGYYRRPRRRVGTGPGTDFFTATSAGPVFGELVAAACRELLGPRPAAEFTFVEIGAEPGGGVLAGVPHPFRAARTVPLGAPLDLAGPTIVFSNELFDAQPFARWVFRAGRWRERGVTLAEGRLREVETDGRPPPRLPAAAPEGYAIDAPLGSVALLERLVAAPWSGLFVAFDYGKSWTELTEATPAGTARAYRRHVQSNDLLAFPGDQDLTCHLCWDWLAETLAGSGFASPTLESQEAFFVRHAGPALSALAQAPVLNPKKRALTQLLHPGQLGQKFQVLHAFRPPA
jgi:SAM-dependent MidA family methyltransferase